MMDPDTINRLVFIKYLHSLAQQQAGQPEPLNATAILTLHDTVDLFLQLAAEHRTTTSHDGTFRGYWKTIQDEHGNPPAQQSAMERLNRARVNLKHAGIRPAREDVTGLLAATTLFLTENTTTIFGTSYQEIGLHQLINHPQAREHLRLAATARAANDSVQALVELGLAFHWLIDDFRDSQREHDRLPRGHQWLLNARHREVQRSLRDESQRALARYLEELTNLLNEVYGAHAMLSLGINYREYTRFRSLTFGVMRTTATAPEKRYRVDIPSSAARTYAREELDFCTTFVITVGLTLSTHPQTPSTALSARPEKTDDPPP